MHACTQSLCFACALVAKSSLGDCRLKPGPRLQIERALKDKTADGPTASAPSWMVQELRRKGLKVQRVTLVTFTTKYSVADTLKPRAPGLAGGPTSAPAVAPASGSAPGPAALPQRAPGPGQAPAWAPVPSSTGQEARSYWIKMASIIVGEFASLKGCSFASLKGF